MYWYSLQTQRSASVLAFHTDASTSNKVVRFEWLRYNLYHISFTQSVGRIKTRSTIFIYDLVYAVHCTVLTYNLYGINKRFIKNFFVTGSGTFSNCLGSQERASHAGWTSGAIHIAYRIWDTVSHIKWVREQSLLKLNPYI